MSTELKLIRVDPSAIAPNRTLPYRIFTADGALLASLGSCIRDPHKVEILRQYGWRQADSLAEAKQAPAPEPTPPAPNAPAARLKPRPCVPLPEAIVLVADDMPLARTLLTRLLTSQGIGRVTAVENGKQAITRFFMDMPHLVLLDIDMPNVDGLNALEQIKCWSPETFVGLVSANSTRANAQAALAHQADAFLVKPYTILSLQRILARYTARVPKPGSA